MIRSSSCSASARVLPVLAALAACSPDTPPAPTSPAPPREPAPAAGPTAPHPIAIPARFRGEWNAELSACGTGRSDSRLTIGERQVRFYESTGAVEAVEQPNADELRVTLTLSGEGQTWDAAHHFRLSPDGATLSDAASGLARRRCP